MADRVGQQLGNYRLIRLLGKGGFAEVYLGQHIYLETQAAIKVLLTQLALEDMEPFRLEAKRVAHLEHPSIVRVLEFGLDGTTPYLAMSYAPNGTLRERHPRGVALPVLTVLGYVKQAADALQYAHDEHFIHRDVKPENLLVGRRQEILLSDFGIALLTQTSRSQSMQDVAGTASYMAPEQFQGKPRPPSDQYSLGVVVYEWLSGDRPFHGSFTEIASQHLFVPPPPLHEKMSDIPVAVEKVVMTALAKDPKHRFGTVQAFATALEQACQATQSQEMVITPPTDQSQVPTERAKQPPSPIPGAPPSPPEPPSTQVATPSHPDLPPAQMATPPHLAFPPTPTQLAVPYTTQSQQTEVQTDAKETFAATELAKPKGQFFPSHAEPFTSAKPQRAGQNMSRRAVLIGLGGLAVVGSGITWFALSQGQKTPAATPTPGVGSTLYTYTGHAGLVVHAVAWSPDGKRIASSSYDKTVQVWDAADGGNVYTYRGHSAQVWAVAWSPDGKRIASASDDDTVQVWDAADGGNVYTYRGHANYVTAVAWSPDGKRIASGDSIGMVQVWVAE